MQELKFRKIVPLNELKAQLRDAPAQGRSATVLSHFVYKAFFTLNRILYCPTV
jgi:hypothetical protein